MQRELAKTFCPAMHAFAQHGGDPSTLANTGVKPFMPTIPGTSYHYTPMQIANFLGLTLECDVTAGPQGDTPNLGYTLGAVQKSIGRKFCSDKTCQVVTYPEI